MTLCQSCHKPMTGEHKNKKRHTKCAGISSAENRMRLDLIRGHKCLTCKKPMTGENVLKERHTRCANVTLGEKQNERSSGQHSRYAYYFMHVNEGMSKSDGSDGSISMFIAKRSRKVV